MHGIIFKQWWNSKWFEVHTKHYILEEEERIFKMKFYMLLIAFCVFTIPESASERCDDWGVDNMKLTQLYEGEAARISCPLFQDFLKHNYSTAHSAGLTLMWYRTGQGKDLEEPINIRLPDNRINKDKDTLWFRPALLNDTGNYTCMLRNTSFCSRVAFPLEVLRKDPGFCVSQAEKVEVIDFYLNHQEILTCPDTDGFFPSNVTPTVTWYMGCELVDGFVGRFPEGLKLIFTAVAERFKGNYTCIVTYEENGKLYNLTRTRSVKVFASPTRARPPSMTSPNNKTTYSFAPGEEMLLPCNVDFSFIKNSHTDIWWLVDGKNAENTDPKINVTASIVTSSVGDKTITKFLNIKSITPEDIKRNYTCIASNTLGTISRQALLKEKVGTPRYITELACGLGATVILVVCLIVVYHVYWLEMVLFYRAHFGTDETVGDGKEYDVYVSYARNAEEEEFVLVTLRGVLENEFGYKLCIFDRDSLPGGNTMEAVLDFIQRSRRMIVVLSPDYLTDKSISMLEFKLGMVCQNAACTSLIVVEYKPLQGTHTSISKLKETTPFVCWEGEVSRKSSSRFWKALRLALPLRSLTARSSWNESCSSQSDISLDQIQKKKRRLKGAPVTQSVKASARDKNTSTGSVKVKNGPKSTKACQCCVTYCDSENRLRSKCTVGAKPKWETHLCKPVTYGNKTCWVQNGAPQQAPAPPPVTAFTLQQYTDLSNNNSDFYIL
ncbi:interleukin-1 receptor accessory isoform X1 [Pelobates cultripes]|uniref:Interleukin-1 receptor accessory isoform X1 n=1 Tax=Pelobates cultripes TaxID=61616 RepID=A0AAD1VU57_PELCU|nr:interleukin-1 receptor accessory isoform X1 [Pelobates cultripes]